MFSSDLTLNEFVCFIPICQSEADLGSMLKIFQQTNCQSIAVPKYQNSWGIVDSHHLLSFLSKSWQQLPLAMVSHPKYSLARDGLTPKAMKNLDSLIQPAIVYQANTPIAEFLRSLSLAQNSVVIEQNHYLIINAFGHLAGKLDQDKLLRYLASEYSKTAVTTPKQKRLNPSHTLLGLLDRLTIPLKLANDSGQDLYLNQAWRSSIDKLDDDCDSSIQESETSLAVWWIDQQLNTLPPKTEPERFSLNYQGEWDYCPLEDRPHFSNQEIELEPTEAKIHSLTAADRCRISCALDNLTPTPTEESSLEIQIESGAEWDYLKLPLRIETKALSQPPANPYWLTLAVKPNRLELSPSQLNSLTASNGKPTMEKLLTTLSHELKSPLTGIVGLSSLLKAEKIGSLNQRQALYLQLIHHGGQKLMGIVNSLFELTSLTTDNLELKPEAIDLASLCHQIYQQAIARLQSEDYPESEQLPVYLPLKLEIEPGAEIAMADSLRLSSILTHLIQEGIEFSRSASFLRLQINLKRSSQETIIHILNDRDPLAESISISSSGDLHATKQSWGLNLILAKYLANNIQGTIQSMCTAKTCSFTLKLPKNKTEQDPLDSSLTVSSKPDKIPNNLTILCLYPEPEVIDSQIESHHGLDFNLKHWAEQDWSNRHRIIEADGLLQAHTLARIWQLDVIVLDGHQIANPQKYLRSLQDSEYLSALPLVTLDTKTTEAANQIEGLNVYPCLLPAERRSFKDLIQVIQIATGT